MKKYIALLGLGLLLTNAASADIIVQYTFPNDTYSPTTVAPNVAATPTWSTGSSADLRPGGGTNSVVLQLRTLSPTPAAAVANDQYFHFTVTPSPGFELDLTSLTFDSARCGDSAPRGWLLRSSLDGFAADIATADIPTVIPALTPFAIDLTGAAFQNVSSATTFRIYGYAPEDERCILFDNLTLNGQVAVPEPASWIAFGIGLLGLASYSRRKRRMGL